MRNAHIRAVFFDLGNVLVNLEVETAARQLAEVTGLKERDAVAAVVAISHDAQYELGHTSSRDFVQRVSRQLGVPLPFEEFAAAWNNMFSENPPMIELARSLRGRVHRHILSNTNELHINHITERFPFFREFDGYTLSYRDGVAKPDPAIYRLALERAQVDAAHSLFIDDREENVIGAGAVGMNVVQYANRTQAMKEIQQCLQLD
jgi:putative hydrolase of the HAD superfamily